MGGKTSTSTSTQAIPSEVLARYNAVNARAEQVAQTPFQPYSYDPNAFVAPLTPTQQAGIANTNLAQGISGPYYGAATTSLLSGAQNAYPYYGAATQDIESAQVGAQPYMGVATGLGLAGARNVNPQALTGRDINTYMSPYLSSVVGSTLTNLRQQQQQEQSGLLGSQIQAGAFGGDRGRIAAANLARQQELATGQTVSGLLNQGYQQALQTAQQQQGLGLSAEQANRAAQAQAAQQMAALGQQGFTQGLQAAQARQGLGQGLYGIGAGVSQGLAGLGTGAQQAALTGAAAQLQAGTAEQQTQQAGLSALYNQYLQQQGYPFQVAQFLANVALGTGALSGSTTTTTQPSSFFSDERLKEDIEPIGQTYDGQKIVKFRYKGQPGKQIGLLAQDVEKHHPEAVGESQGYKTVDYDEATKNAAHKGHYLHGGLVPQSEGGAVHMGHAGEGYAKGGNANLERIEALLTAHRQMYPYGSIGLYGEPMANVGPYKTTLQERRPSGLERPRTLDTSVITTPALARGGVVPHMADGGAPNYAQILAAQQAMYGNTPWSAKGGVGGLRIPTESLSKPRELPQARSIPQVKSSTEQTMDELRGGVQNAAMIKGGIESGKSALFGSPATKDAEATAGLLGFGGKYDPSASNLAAARDWLQQKTGIDSPVSESNNEEYSPRSRGGYAVGGLPYSNAENEYVPEDISVPKQPQGGLAPAPQQQPGSSDFQKLAGLIGTAAATKYLFLKDGGVAGRQGYEDGGTPDEDYVSAFEQAQAGAERQNPTVPGLAPAPRRSVVSDIREAMASRPNYDRQAAPYTPRTSLAAQRQSDWQDQLNRQNTINDLIGDITNPQMAPGTLAEQAARQGTDSVPGTGDARTAEAVGYRPFQSGIAPPLPEAKNTSETTLTPANYEGLSIPSDATQEASVGLAPQINKPSAGLGVAPSTTKEESKVPGFLTSEKFWVPLLTGLGTMAASPSRYLGSAMLQGIGGGAKAYEDVSKNIAEREKIEAEAGQTEAQESAILAGINSGAIKQEANGLFTVRSYDPTARRFITQNNVKGSELKNMMLSPAMRQNIMSAGVPQTAQAAPTAQAAQPSATETQPQINLEDLSKKYELPTSIIMQAQENAKRINEEGFDLKTADESENVINNTMNIGNAARQSKAQINQLGKELKKSTDSKLTSNLLDGVANYINPILRSSGIPEIAKGTIASGEAVNKLVASLGDLRNRGMSNPSVENLYNTLRTLPGNETSPAGKAKLMAAVMSENQRQIDEANYFNKVKDVYRDLGLSPKQISFAMRNMQEEFYRNEVPLINQDKELLEQIYNKEYPKGSGKTVFDVLNENPKSIDMTKLEKYFVDNGYAPGSAARIMRYFGG